MFSIIGLVGFAGVVVFGVLYMLFYLKDGSLKLPIIGMAVCFLVVVASAVLTQMGVGGTDDPTADGSPAPTGVVETEPAGTDEPQGEESVEPMPTPTEPPKDGVFTVGDSVSMKDITVTLVDVSESGGGDFMKPSDGKVFLLCEFRIENNSQKDIAVSSVLSFEAYVDDYSTSMNLSAMTSSDKPQLDGSVAAGKKMNGVIGYEVDEGWNSIEVRFTPDFWSGNEFIFTYSK